MGRIIIVTPDAVGPVKNGGIGTACLHYARALAEAGHEVQLLFVGPILSDEELNRWREWYARLEIAFYAVNDVPKVSTYVHGFRWYTQRSWRVMQWLRDRGADGIIFQDWHAIGFWTVRAKQMGYDFETTPVAVITHSPTQWQKAGMKTFGTDVLNQADLEWCERQAIAGADLLISPTRHMVEWMRSHGFDLPDEARICPCLSGDAGAEAVGAPVDRDHLIFFGRLETRKGLHLFGGALRALSAQGRPLPRKISLLGKYELVEDEPAQDYLARLAGELPQVEVFVETGFDHREAIDYLRAANGVVVMPSLLDNSPLTVIECIDNRLAFITSAVGGVPELVDPALLFPPSVDGLAEKLDSRAHLDFAGASHPYHANEARAAWLGAVGHLLATEPERPPVWESEPLPPISVCIPFHRHDHYLPRLLRAFLAMDLPDLQLVIVDDGTPREERPQLEAARAELEAAGHIVHSQANSGPGAARNKAASLAAHDLLLFFDADNVPFPDLVPALWRSMSRIGADSISAPFCAVNPTTRIPRREDERWRFHPVGGSLALGLFSNQLGDTTCLIRRNAFEAIGGFEPKPAGASWEDWEFFYKLLGAGFRHFVHPEPLLFYTHHQDGKPSPSESYDLWVSLFSQLESLDRPALLSVARTLAVHTLVEQARGAAA